MVILRPTGKLRTLLPTSPAPAHSDTALGDWYVNRIVVRRRPLLLLVSSTSLLPLVLPARDVRSLPQRLPAVVAARLRRSGIAPPAIDAERKAMQPAHIAPTVDRSVLGIMVDFAIGAQQFSGDVRTEDGLVALEDWLAERPCHAGSSRVVFPEDKAPELLHATWLTTQPLRSLSDGGIVVH